MNFYKVQLQRNVSRLMATTKTYFMVKEYNNISYILIMVLYTNSDNLFT